MYFVSKQTGLPLELSKHLPELWNNILLCPYIIDDVILSDKSIGVIPVSDKTRIHKSDVATSYSGNEFILKHYGANALCANIGSVEINKNYIISLFNNNSDIDDLELLIGLQLVPSKCFIRKQGAETAVSNSSTLNWVGSKYTVNEFSSYP